MTKQEQIEEMRRKIYYARSKVNGIATSNDIAEALYEAGYRNISEYEAEIKRLEEKCEELLNEKWDAQDDLDCYYDEMPTRINQAVQDFVEKAKAKSETFLVAKGDGVYGEKPYVSIEKIDELIKEYEK